MEDLPRSANLPSLLEDARRRLVETGTRNRLIHVNRSAARSNALDLLKIQSVDLFDRLRVQGKPVYFRPREEGLEEGPEEGLEEGLEEGRVRSPMTSLALVVGENVEGGQNVPLSLETRLGSEALQRRLLTLYTDARTAEEEQGVNLLYLALGFLRWYESDSSQVLRESPLILLAVELVRDERRSRFALKARDIEIETNLPLQERLKADFGFELPNIEEEETFSPDAYFAELESRIEVRPRWSIDRNGAQLGFFSFSKLLMMRDLEPERWPEDAFDKHPVLGGLLAGGFAQDPPLFRAQEPLDPRLPPEALLHVVPADASQTRVIEEVRAGRNLVVQGPPGTGKSQTIANIIAGAAYDGKTVLFVAEKMAALSVVHDRLCKVGLGDLCLEIHSRAANKKAFLDELARTLAAGQNVPDVPGAPERLRATRDRLNRITALLHERVPGRDYTPFQVIAEIARLIGRDISPPQIPTAGLEALDAPGRQALVDRVAAWVELIRQAGSPNAHPFAGVSETGLQPTDLQRVGPELEAAITALTHLQDTLTEITSSAGLPALDTLPAAVRLQQLLQMAAERPTEGREATEVLLGRIEEPRLVEALAIGADWAKARAEVALTFSESASEIAADALRARLAPGVGSFWARLFGGYRGASRELATLLSGPLPANPAERLQLVDQLVMLRRRRATLSTEEGWLQDALGGHWRGERTPFAALQAQAVWLGQVTAWLHHVPDPSALESLAAAPVWAVPLARGLATAEAALAQVVSRLGITWPDGEETGLGDIRHRLGQMREALDRYGEWVRLVQQSAALRGAGLGPLLEALESGSVPPGGAVDELCYAIAEARWAAARTALPELDALAQEDRHALVAAFRNLEQDRLEETRRLVRAKHLAQLPTGASGQMGFLRGEMGKKRRHRSIRQMMQEAGPMVQRIKPVLLMSPISIAQYLPPGSVQFDLLVIDEASQVRPEEAFGAIVRSRQIVVVGDQKQLPPTSFFDRLSGSEEMDAEEEEVHTARATEMESVLTLCEARGLNPAMLEWHYRSRDPSLIMVNNAEFYEHRLVLPPSPVQNDPAYGLALRRVPGVYTSRGRGTGRPGTNRIEAEAIAQEIAEHARSRPDLSLGVVAFSKTQSDMLTEVLELARRQDAELDAFLREGRAEDVFVKNIENVQGDERDVILISVGYGPAMPGGRLATMSFGPINGEGGERRLNVLFSRARTRCLVFCSFDPGDIDLNRISRDGPRVLKRFLEFARSGQLEQPEVTGELPDSPFESDVADQIRRLGYPCDYQVGSAGFRIDLGVRHPDQPGRYILAVECDGATYHSALWARERDRLRQDVLEGLGWRFHRIWSTDWFHRRLNEVDRLRAALEAARAAQGPDFAGANHNGIRLPPAMEPASVSVPEEIVLPAAALRASAYVPASYTVHAAFEPHEAPHDLLEEAVFQVVAAEGPLHRDLLARRVATAFGKARTGGRIRTVSDMALERAVAAGRLLLDGEFAMTGAQRENPPVRDRSAESTQVTQAGLLPPVEIRAAAAWVVAESGETPREELIVATARLLGFSRVGADLRAVIDAAL